MHLVLQSIIEVYHVQAFLQGCFSLLSKLMRSNATLKKMPMCRFALQLEVGMPDAKQREAILRLYLRKQAAESRIFQGSVTIDEELLDVNFSS